MREDFVTRNPNVVGGSGPAKVDSGRRDRRSGEVGHGGGRSQVGGVGSRVAGESEVPVYSAESLDKETHAGVAVGIDGVSRRNKRHAVNVGRDHVADCCRFNHVAIFQARSGNGSQLGKAAKRSVPANDLRIGTACGQAPEVDFVARVAMSRDGTS